LPAEIKFQKILRYTTQAMHSGGYLTYADLGCLLGIHITHRKKIIRLYLEMHTEIVACTGHSYEAIENYIREFAAVLVPAERGLTVPLIRRVTGGDRSPHQETGGDHPGFQTASGTRLPFLSGYHPARRSVYARTAGGGL